ncbi:Uncharacterised protein [Mycobacteroides abscessus subsp. massiliense]|nr:Uncharacterised protein [Mycobacteroides abscessus subsp. massiliense]
MDEAGDWTVFSFFIVDIKRLRLLRCFVFVVDFFQNGGRTLT